LKSAVLRNNSENAADSVVLHKCLRLVPFRNTSLNPSVNIVGQIYYQYCDKSRK